MKDRSTELLTLRPKITTIQYEKSSNPAETFQNETLRPILKFQNDLLLSAFQSYLFEKKVNTEQWNEEKGNIYIQQVLQKDVAFRFLLQGMILGQMTTEELETFHGSRKTLSKRLMSMIIQRLQSQVEVFMR